MPTRNFAKKRVQLSGEVDPVLVDIIFDAQTSGGMVLSVSVDKIDDVCNYLTQKGDLACIIGEVKPFGGKGFLKII